MEITWIKEKQLRIKTRQGMVLVNPDEVSKSKSEGICLFTHASSFIYSDDQCLSIFAPGEYEKNGIEVTVKKIKGNLFFSCGIENMGVLISLQSDWSEVETIVKGMIKTDVIVVDASNVGKNSKLVMGAARKLSASYLVVLNSEKSEEAMKSFLDEVDEETLAEMEVFKVGEKDLEEDRSGVEVVRLKQVE